MFKITNKNISAQKGDPAINRSPIREILQKLWNKDPDDAKNQNNDNGLPKPNAGGDGFMTGFGPNDRSPTGGMLDKPNSDHSSAADSLTSGYTDGGQADDETGPGNSSQVANPYFTSNYMYNDWHTIQNASGSRDKDINIQKQVRRMLQGPGVVMPSKRKPVD